MSNMLEDSAKQVFAAHCGGDVVRAIEAGGDASALWLAITEAGFADALIPEAQGGTGLHPSDLGVVLLQAGAAAVPLPLGQTMMVRAVLSEPDTVAGPITIAAVAAQTAAGLILRNVPYGRVADWVVAQVSGAWCLLPCADATVTPSAVHGSLAADLQWSELPAATALPDRDWRAVGALMTAATMAGAMQHLLAQTVTYAGDRIQFGKPIGKQQAIQQQLSVMAEQCYAARMAAQLGLSLPDNRDATAVAKSRVGEAAAQVGPIAHAVHGAIGITEEYDLQLLTRHLIEGRAAYGGETYWAGELGRSVLATDKAPLAFVQDMSAGKRLPEAL